MPLNRYLLLILTVLVAAGATVWLITLSGPTGGVAALLAVLVAAVALRYLLR